MGTARRTGYEARMTPADRVQATSLLWIVNWLILCRQGGPATAPPST